VDAAELEKLLLLMWFSWGSNMLLLKKVGMQPKPAILLKRGMSKTTEERLMAAEYITASWNQNVILCERILQSWTASIPAIPLSVKASCDRPHSLSIMAGPVTAQALQSTFRPRHCSDWSGNRLFND